MGSSVQFPVLFAAEPGAEAGVSFARFMELALYHPEAGYYAQRRRRIGREASTDFFTATSLGPVFGELVAAAAVGLLGPADPATYEFVEIGAEPSGGVLAEVSHPFARSRTVGHGQAITLAENCVVFSNELFDAQPCHRLVRRDGAWRELGVAWRGGSTGDSTAGTGAFVEVVLPQLSAEVAAIGARLPADAREGYHLDLPLRSVALLREIALQPWRGLFLAFDYGRTWRELVEEMPQGTVRAYAGHRQSSDLLARPGEQDLTCHVCWDWLAEALAEAGFSAPQLESQESFLARHAADRLAAIVAAEATRFSPRKQALLQLLHPGQMGQKFQVLHGLRR